MLDFSKRCCMCMRKFDEYLRPCTEEYRVSGKDMGCQKWIWCAECWMWVEIEAARNMVSAWDYLEGYLKLVRRIDEITGSPEESD